MNYLKLISKYKVGVFGVLIVGLILLYVSKARISNNGDNFSASPTQGITSSPSKIQSQNKEFIGTLKTGADIGEEKSYCPQGFYLVADEGTYLIGQITMLQLRSSDNNDDSQTSSLRSYVGKKVRISGKYPAQEVFCEALICQCDDYILVGSVEAIE